MIPPPPPPAPSLQPPTSHLPPPTSHLPRPCRCDIYSSTPRVFALFSTAYKIPGIGFSLLLFSVWSKRVSYRFYSWLPASRAIFLFSFSFSARPGQIQLAQVARAALIRGLFELIKSRPRLHCSTLIAPFSPPRLGIHPDGSSVGHAARISSRKTIVWKRDSRDLVRSSSLIENQPAKISPPPRGGGVIH